MAYIKRDFALAVKAMIKREDTFLVLKRSKREMENSYMNQKEVWDLPGGGVRFFETSVKALYREIEEETKLTVKVLRPFSVYDAIKNQLHLTILTYLCEYEKGQVRLSWEHENFYWLTVEEMRQRELPRWMIRNFEDALKEPKSSIEGKLEKRKG